MPALILFLQIRPGRPPEPGSGNRDGFVSFRINDFFHRFYWIHAYAAHYLTEYCRSLTAYQLYAVAIFS